MNTSKQDLIKVKLLKDGHTHAGVTRKKDEEIFVTASQAAFLAANGLINPATVPTPARPGPGKE